MSEMSETPGDSRPVPSGGKSPRSRAVAFNTGPEDLVSWCWYEFAYLINFPLYRSLWGLRVKGTPRVPRKGPLLVITNHQSMLDPLGMGVAMRRHMAFLARKNLFSNKFFAAAIRTLGAVPVDREGSGISGLKAVMSLLDAGRAVLIFPEGSRTENGRMSAFEPGVTTIIRKKKPTVLPVGIAGAYEAWPRASGIKLSLPIFPPTSAAMAMSIGEPLSGEELAEMDRDAQLRFLFDRVAKEQFEAEKLRRQGRYLSGELLKEPVLNTWPETT